VQQAWVNRKNTVQQTNASPISVRERIAGFTGAMNAEQLADILAVSPITVYKQAKKRVIPSFRIGTCVRFSPKAVADWVARIGAD
jgi:excisionase family DNA binding protein